MLKKSIFTIGFISLIITGVLSWQNISYSESEDEIKTECSEKGQCCVTYHKAMDAVEGDWSMNLKDLRDQEKPSSEMAGEAYENLRTYNCWLEYICKAVRYSGIADPKSVKGTGLTNRHIKRIAGCQKPQKMSMGPVWDAFVQEELQTYWDENKGGEGDYFLKKKLNIIPQCMTDTDGVNNQHPDILASEAQYANCMEVLGPKIESNFVQLETALKENNAHQKSNALENKLFGILTKMKTMQGDVEYMKTRLNSLSSRYQCSPSKC